MNGRLRNMTSVYISSGDKMLLLYRIGSSVGADSWRGIGGHFEPNELNDAKACALRELNEEMGIMEGDLDNLALRYITLRFVNGEIRQNYYFFADLRNGVTVSSTCSEGTPEWVAYDNILDREMPYTAKYVFEHYLSVGRNNDKLYGGVAVENGVDFKELNEF